MENKIQALRESICQLKLVYQEKLSFLIAGETKTFYHKEKLKDFVTTKPALQKILKGFLCREEETKTFYHKEKLKDFVITKSALQKILKEFLCIEEETRVRQVY
jgi:hypothetical protein